MQTLEVGQCLVYKEVKDRGRMGGDKREGDKGFSRQFVGFIYQEVLIYYVEEEVCTGLCFVCIEFGRIYYFDSFQRFRVFDFFVFSYGGFLVSFSQQVGYLQFCFFIRRVRGFLGGSIFDKERVFFIRVQESGTGNIYRVRKGCGFLNRFFGYRDGRLFGKCREEKS